MRSVCIAILLALAPLPVAAGDLSVTVKDKAGHPVQNAVVMVYPASGLPAGPIRFAWPLSLSQRDVQFAPFVLVVPVGAKVSFPNFDKVRHHVYSFSAGNKFELKLYGRDETHSITFKTAGVAAVGCNIHDAMSAFIRVVDTPYAIKTGTNGLATFRGLPGGAAAVRVYQPYLRAPKNEVAISAQIPATGAVTLSPTLDIRAPATGMRR